MQSGMISDSQCIRTHNKQSTRKANSQLNAEFSELSMQQVSSGKMIS